MYKQYQNFGEFVQEKREDKQITLRKFADTIGFSAPFWSDVEKDRRNPPEIDKLHLIAQILNLTESENAIMLDLAGKKRNSVAPDLPDYIRNAAMLPRRLERRATLTRVKRSGMRLSRNSRSGRGNYRNMYTPSFKVKSNGVPILSKEEIDGIGEQYVKAFCPEVLSHPVPVDIESFVENYLGFTPDYQYLSITGYT
jgi:transcriptional regulator with XRE-family HTH domain